MSTFSAFRYDGKRALVVGGATGMGAAVAELVQDAGAEVTVMDFAEVKLPGAKAIHLNLGEKSSIDAALDECGGPIDALFSCAGVADGTPNIEKINFIGHRYMIDKLLASGDFKRGSAIGFISSAAGLGWESALPLLKEYLDITDFDAAAQWAQEHGKADYFWSKHTICGHSPWFVKVDLKHALELHAMAFFHPTARGQRELEQEVLPVARRVTSASRSTEPPPGSARPISSRCTGINTRHQSSPEA